MSAPDFASVVPQFPLNGGGLFGQNGIMSYGRFYTASGGMVGLGQSFASGIATGIKNAGPAGWPGIGATLVGTGRYNVMHPPATIVSLNPSVATPSGVGLVVNQVRGPATGFASNSQTGITQLQVLGVSTGIPGLLQPQNPPTGTRFDLWLYTAPNNTSGFTQF